MALALAAFAIVGYYMKTHVEDNPVTGKPQRIALTPAEEVAMGLQAAPEMAAQHGGPHPNRDYNEIIDRIGKKLVDANSRGAWAEWFARYNFEFHLLRDSETVNAFALPGGQVFFTHGLFKYLENENEVAGVLGHEIGHVIGRHSAEQIGRSQMWAGIAQAVGMAGADFQLNPQQIAGLIYQVKTTSYGREHENQADELGVKFMVNAGFDPEGLIKVMRILKEKGGGGDGPEFLMTHPDPGNRIEHIRKVIEDVKRNGTGIDKPPASAPR